MLGQTCKAIDQCWPVWYDDKVSHHDTMLTIDPPDYWELLEEPLTKKLVHYTDSEGFEDWFDLHDDTDLVTFNQVCTENNQNGISWKIELVETEEE